MGTQIYEFVRQERSFIQKERGGRERPHCSGFNSPQLLYSVDEVDSAVFDCETTDDCLLYWHSLLLKIMWLLVTAGLL